MLAASVFHFGQFSIRQVKEYMASQGIPVRLDFRSAIRWVSKFGSRRSCDAFGSARASRLQRRMRLKSGSAGVSRWHSDERRFESRIRPSGA